MTADQLSVVIPASAFVALALGERLLPALPASGLRRLEDWAMDLIGLLMQGLLVPLAGYAIATHLLAPAIPAWRGVLVLPAWGAFAVNVIGIDFLYYLQHRAFHRVPLLWGFHRSHHASPEVDVWASARNSLLTNLMFVYLLVNPVLGYLCSEPGAFFAGAGVTAALDLMRHTRVRLDALLPAWLYGALSTVLVMPRDHHWHHAADTDGNYGANFIIWDRLFGTAMTQTGYPRHYRVTDAPSALAQLVHPLL